MLRQQYGIVLEPKDVDYQALIRTMQQWCSTGLLVVRPRLGLSPQASELLAQLAPNVTDRRDTASWPGTVLLDGHASVVSFRLVPSVVTQLLAATTQLYGWQQPLLPEDLCLLRGGGEPALVSIAHEADSYLTLDDDEVDVLKRAVPGITLEVERPTP